MRRSQRPRSSAAEAIARPSPERLNHGRVERLTATVMDAAGGIGRPYRAVGALEIMRRAGTIGEEGFVAGSRFNRDFVLAGLDPLMAADPTRLPVLIHGLRHERRVQGSEAVRDQVMRALAALGGPTSVLGSCAWHVLGREISLRAWVVIYRPGNPRPSTGFATGILTGALDLLQIHYVIKPR